MLCNIDLAILFKPVQDMGTALEVTVESWFVTELVMLILIVCFRVVKSFAEWTIATNSIASACVCEDFV